jgi:hypothetical protein
MKLFVYEGSPREIAEVAIIMGSSSPIPAYSGPDGDAVEDGSDVGDELTVDQVKQVLTRRSLAEPLENMLVLLYKANNARMKSDDLKEALAYNAHQFRGMLGAFGRRLKNTQGIPKGVRLFDEYWDEELRQKTWALSANVRKALEDLGIV